MQTPVDDSGIFTEVLRSTQTSPSPRWSPLQGSPHDGQAPGRVAPWIAPGLPHMQVGLWLSHSWQSLSRTAPRHLHYHASGRNTVGLVPSGTRWQPHHKRSWCGLARLTSPTKYNNGVRKHRVSRGMQTSLATKPKPRASVYEHGLINLSTSQSTYANHLIFC